VLVRVLGGLTIEWGYLTAFMMFDRGVLGAVLIGVYVFILLGVGIWLMLLCYVVLGHFLPDNYKVLGLGILPLVTFFVKVCGSYLLMWMVMIHAMFNVL